MTEDRVQIPGYYERHSACPKCGSDEVESKTAGIIMGRDRNPATCINRGCGWRGFVHDLVPKKSAT